MTTEVAATTIVYPETDGMPLPDGETQSPIFVAIQGMLTGFFSKIRGARVNGDTFIYFIEGNPRRSVSPDCYVVLGLSDEVIASIERRNSYLLWEVGKPPDFVLEIGSPSTGSVDLGSKRDLYAEIGVPGVLAIRPDGRATTTANRWWASGWWTGSMRGFRWYMRMTVRYGLTATP